VVTAQVAPATSKGFRVAILSRAGYRSPRYLAAGLQRMLHRVGAKPDCYLHGISWLEAIRQRHASRRHRALAALADVWVRYLRRYDLIVVSDTIGAARDPALLAPLRTLRKPIFLYEVFALNGSKHWLDRFPSTAVSLFDAFLVSSAIHDNPPVAGPPIFEVGLELLEPPTQTRDKPPLAMIDFPREGYEDDRRLQLDALADIGMPHFSLQGEYTFDQIVGEYERSAVAFLAFPEAFGVPIAQLQNQGSLIASPNRSWAKRHALLPAGSVFEADAPFTDNFIFYADCRDLAEQLEERTRELDPAAIAQRFREQQPQLAEGNLAELRRALQYARDSDAWRR
jgi:hypothetical protein